MKCRGKQYIAFVFAVAILVTSSIFIPKVYGSAGNVSTMFVNDKAWENESIFGWEMSDGRVYVPISMFAKLSKVTVSVTTMVSSATISCGDKYIAIDTKSCESAYTEESKSFYMKTYFKSSTSGFQMLYVPADTVCNYFDFNLEVFEGQKAVRISDQTATMTFDEVISMYSPSLKNDGSDTTDFPVTGPISGDTEPDNSTKVYLIFRLYSETNTVKILDMLAESNVKASFIMSKENIESYNYLVRDIYAGGHSICLVPHGDSAAYYDSGTSLYDELNSANRVLYKLTKQKTRIVFLKKKNTLQGVSAVIEPHGYRLFSAYDPETDPNGNPVIAVDNTIRRMMNNKLSFVVFSGNAVTIKALPDILEYIEENNEKYILRPLNAASQ